MSVIESQILNKVIGTKDFSLIDSNCLSADFFPSYKEEFKFLFDYFKSYNEVPDKFTFLSHFPNFELYDVEAQDKYLIDSLKEEHVFQEIASAINQSTELIRQNSYKGVEFLLNKINQIQMETGVACVDIIQSVDTRLNVYKQKCLGDLNFYIKSGFDELDKVTNGWQRGEEFVVITARTGVGKSWFLIATAEKAWEAGCRVAFISPEMTANSVGYRFDTIKGHFSNASLTFGKKLDGYEDYAKDLKRCNNGFFVATPKDFQNKVTVSKIKVFCELNKVDMLCIDGISYLADERSHKSDNRTMELTHISEDLMQLSNDLQIPVLAVVQSNRNATVNKDEAPDLESIRDSDGIAYNATRVLALRQSGGSTIEIKIRKNRNGISGGKVCYNWDAEHGNFIYLPIEDDALHTRPQDKNNQDNQGQNDNVFIGTDNPFISKDNSDVF